tara:strand:- start:663 stop:1070 length:408 start_codon:yes stop_codon:yes gene_type:complete
MKALLVPPLEVVSIWKEVEPLIDKALKHSTEELYASDFLVSILQGTRFLWVGTDADEIQSVLLVEPIQHPRNTSLFIHVWSTKSGYEGTDWLSFWEEIENFGRINGCDFIEAKARKGLAKKLGWTNKHSLITKTL